ncbi:uncharacterized protein LOC132547309 [Ylistrum balloti]|uniref:uncharacterized protein LOC132547309 n=1 Tax=Ylistrum balloti TaxID=509963 RepID=UPI0029059A74|nr:uncharacterized protein LOC132547309 [Ylistrum balloti]
MAGSWERLIGTVRRILDSMLRNTDTLHLTHEVLTTFLAEACAIVNQRPLVPVSDDPENPVSTSTASSHSSSLSQHDRDSPTYGRGRGGKRRGRGGHSRGCGVRETRGRGQETSASRPRGRGRGRGRTRGTRADSAVDALQQRRQTLRNRVNEMEAADAMSLLLRVVERFSSMVFDLVEDAGAAGSGGYHPPPGANSPPWCSFGNCREMPTAPERLCCRKDPANCITNLPDFQVLVLDEAVLALARLYRQDTFALPEEEDWNKANRHAAYRQYIFWQLGRLGTGDRRVIPSCAVWKIRERYPDQFGQYTGFKASRLA